MISLNHIQKLFDDLTGFRERNVQQVGYKDKKSLNCLRFGIFLLSWLASTLSIETFATTTMTFNDLHADIVCRCTDEGCNISNESTYALKTMQNILREQDFTSYWAKGKRPDGTDCNDVCSYKGNSISIFTDETKEFVITLYKTIFPLAPKYKPFLSIVRFNGVNGVVKPTPFPQNPHHYDFYKSDDFVLANVELIQSTSFADL